ncbi:hypothetical protein [Actinoplanes sp. NPDC051494]|uniref:hypothetical protein n=1 Tax=Actinoplanes sp. NPDC051494 TaxID=3363907 RepID=UPI00379B2B7E
MDLLDRVHQAMRQRHKVHPGTFEECAVALLQVQIPELVGVGGGHDFGRDGDIYFALDAERRGRLTVTIGDVVANVRRSLMRMKDNDIRVDVLVVASLQPVNGLTRQALDKLCDECGVVRPFVYDGDWFALRLVGNPLWRKRLLGVAGELSALLDSPLQELAVPELVGRDLELEALRALAAAGADVVVTGPAGVGKTRLLTAVHPRLKFLQPARTSVDVVDALVQERPTAVVVDDAHAHIDDLVTLRAARRQERLSFSIIAATWPSKRHELDRPLPDAADLMVDPLPRPVIDDIVRSLDITGYTARSVVLDQAGGRPGWAVLLCRLLADGKGDTVVNGAALMDNVERILLQAAESRLSLDVLACVAVLGRTDIELLEQAAEVIDMPRGETRELVERLARNGLLDEAGDGWQLLPALRAPLVAQWFFSEHPRLRWHRVQQSFAEHGWRLGRAAIDAALVAGAPAARQEAQAYIEALPHPRDWSPAVVDSVAAYGRLDEQAAEVVVDFAEQLLAEPGDMPEIRGIVVDSGRGHAVDLLAGVARGWLLPQAVVSLLDLAVNDNRPWHSTPRHPLKILQELATQLHPDFGPSVEVRERLLGATLRWLGDRPQAPQWSTAAELIASDFSVTAGNAWQDPGRPGTLQVVDSVLSAEHLEELAALWSHVVAAVRRDDQCPPHALLLLLELVAGWLRLGEGFAVGPAGTRINDEQRHVALHAGQAMLESLRDRWQGVPGLALRANRLLQTMWQRTATRPDRPALFDVDADLVALIGDATPSLSGDLSAFHLTRSHAVKNLAIRLAMLGPQDGCARFTALAVQARLAVHDGFGLEHDSTDLLAQLMRPHLISVSRWVSAAVSQGCPGLLSAAIHRCLDDSEPLPDTVLADILGDEGLRHAALTAALASTALTEPGRTILDQLGPDDSWLMMTLATSPDTCDDVRHHLLTHHDPAVAGRTALAFDIGQGEQHHSERQQGPLLPEHWRSHWRHAFGRLRSAHLSDESHTYRVAEILTYLACHDPDLAERWFHNRLDDAGTSRVPDSAPASFESAIRRLPLAQRTRLARRCGGRRWAGQSWLTYLVGSDPDVARGLLDDGALSADDLLRALHGQRDETVGHLGPLLLASGTEPEAIATAIIIHRPITLSSAVKQHRELRDFFTQLGATVPKLQQVADLGRREQQALLDQAEADQRHQRRHGW